MIGLQGRRSGVNCLLHIRRLDCLLYLSDILQHTRLHISCSSGIVLLDIPHFLRSARCLHPKRNPDLFVDIHPFRIMKGLCNGFLSSMKPRPLEICPITHTELVFRPAINSSSAHLFSWPPILRQALLSFSNSITQPDLVTAHGLGIWMVLLTIKHPCRANMSTTGWNSNMVPSATRPRGMFWWVQL